jgi:hypothetical protein
MGTASQKAYLEPTIDSSLGKQKPVAVMPALPDTSEKKRSVQSGMYLKVERLGDTGPKVYDGTMTRLDVISALKATRDPGSVSQLQHHRSR